MFSNKVPSLSNLDTSGAVTAGGVGSMRSSSPLESPTSDVSSIFIAINEYNKRMDDELDLKLGDKVRVITDDEDYHDGWYYGKNLRTGLEGLYPVVFTQKLSPEKPKSATMEKSIKRLSTPVGGISSLNESLVNEGSMNFERSVSMKNTMSDIDKALEELQRGEELHPNENASNSNNHVSNISLREGLAVVGAGAGAGAVASAFAPEENLNNESDHDRSHNSIQTGTTSLNIQPSDALMNGVQSRSISNQTTVINPNLNGNYTNSNNNNIYTNNNTNDNINDDTNDTSNNNNSTNNNSNDNFNIINNNSNNNSNNNNNNNNNNHSNDGFDVINNKTPHLDPKNALNWSPNDVALYFEQVGFDKDTSSKFIKHKISGEILLELELNLLKELDINSFGTRFEVFKEIEALKQVSSQDGTTSMAAKRASKLMPAAELDQINQEIPTDNNVGRSNSNGRVVSMSHLDSPSTLKQGTPKLKATPSKQQSNLTKHRPASIAVTPDYGMRTNERSPIHTTIINEVSDDDKFVSPRKAPKPPSHPSPVQPPSAASKRFSLSPNVSQMRYKSPSSSAFDKPHSTISTPKVATPKIATPKVATPRTDKFMFPNSTTTLGNNGLHQTSRSSSQYVKHKKSMSGGSFTDLFNRVSLLSPNGYDERKSNAESTETHERATSIYSNHSRSASVTHVRQSSQNMTDMKKHKRNSSILSFFSSKTDDKPNSPIKSNFSRNASRDHSRNSSYANNYATPYKPQASEATLQDTQPDTYSKDVSTPTPIKAMSPTKEDKRRSVSARDSGTTIDFNSTRFDSLDDDSQKRSVSEALKGKTMRKMSGKPMTKQDTTAFVEGLRSISVKEAIQDADCSGWMSKKGGGAMGVWKTRYFTLHGTRLSYFGNTTDTRERGLIDITGHRVVPAKEDDKLISLYAASTGKGRYCFKLIPPLPGSKKGLTFTQPRVHYFAVESKEEMREWMAALIKTSIDIDTNVPVVSSYSTPTVSLNKAQEMLSQAREETRLREENKFLNEEDEDQLLWEEQNAAMNKTPIATSKRASNIITSNKRDSKFSVNQNRFSIMSYNTGADTMLADENTIGNNTTMISNSNITSPNKRASFVPSTILTPAPQTVDDEVSIAASSQYSN
ncbi:hypothetical protein Kpol_1018p107 [Vanderwaltozyma polyspora DSM 70294]|uniref:Protein BOI2 n=1 Tax=Vanderwaltozyma polyspora (strain ATCC 22028 / DSM 70294 / BCRC 21397 / CBS 2163 / NBRC 10782 / NRRL Y-8283 / UCD 57-17) TaxID=436907 RepID=A7TDV4_VANPO|nr:uncharacterized protein Kpol_1018p107 [Vanderwaltozyma polyspora DSM 70294]EDO19574.1 hypothetical protein Kpol_1018p107 [Vanderwaltozyma polyspora DSM 70294]